jgi:hypothetical protein
VIRLTVRVFNQTLLPRDKQPSREEAVLQSLISAHVVLVCKGGNFVSATDPPPQLHAAAAACENIALWPALLGEAPSRAVLLASPIILGDYPQIAAESPGDLFDGGEIDEILTLRVLTLTDDEKRAMQALDPRTRAILERSESLAPEQIARMHGLVHPLPQPPAPSTPEDASLELPADPFQQLLSLPSIHAGNLDFNVGDRVRLRPRAGGDIFDLALAGKTATIASIEQDFENRIHIAVTIDDDPGADLGRDGKPGHRFFFGLNEIEPLGETATACAAEAEGVCDA